MTTFSYWKKMLHEEVPPEFAHEFICEEEAPSGVPQAQQQLYGSEYKRVVWQELQRMLTLAKAGNWQLAWIAYEAAEEVSKWEPQVQYILKNEIMPLIQDMNRDSLERAVKGMSELIAESCRSLQETWWPQYLLLEGKLQEELEKELSGLHSWMYRLPRGISQDLRTRLERIREKYQWNPDTDLQLKRLRDEEKTVYRDKRYPEGKGKLETLSKKADEYRKRKWEESRIKVAKAEIAFLKHEKERMKDRKKDESLHEDVGAIVTMAANRGKTITRERAESVWQKAKAQADKRKDKIKGNYYQYVMGIVKKMLGLKESFDLEEKALTYKERKDLPDSAFVYPGERKYPIHDIAHARAALARVSQHGTPSEKERVRAAVYKRYPSLKESVDEGVGEWFKEKWEQLKVAHAHYIGGPMDEMFALRDLIETRYGNGHLSDSDYQEANRQIESALDKFNKRGQYLYQQTWKGSDAIQFTMSDWLTDLAMQGNLAQIEKEEISPILPILRNILGGSPMEEAEGEQNRKASNLSWIRARVDKGQIPQHVLDKAKMATPDELDRIWKYWKNTLREDLDEGVLTAVRNYFYRLGKTITSGDYYDKLGSLKNRFDKEAARVVKEYPAGSARDSRLQSLSKKYKADLEKLNKEYRQRDSDE